MAESCDICGKVIAGDFKAVVELGEDVQRFCSTVCMEQWLKQRHDEQDADEFLNLGEFVEAEADRFLEQEPSQEQYTMDQPEELKAEGDDYLTGPIQMPVPEEFSTEYQEYPESPLKTTSVQPEVVEGKEFVEEAEEREQRIVKEMQQKLYDEQARRRDRGEEEVGAGEKGTDDSKN